MVKAKALYDFVAQADSNELSLRTGDVLNVVRQDVGDGWWEGVNQSGQRGLFPESYVEVLHETDELSNNGPPPAAPPPPLPEHFKQSTSLHQPPHYPTYDRRDSWNESITPAATVGQAPNQPAHDFDDDWSDDDEEYQAGNGHHNQAVVTSGLSVDSQGVIRNRNRNDANAGSVKKSMNRFSPFVKSGTENYLLNSTKLSSKPSEIIEVVATKDGLQWAPSEAYFCKISSHSKSSKLHGLKSFICYQLTPSINNLQVSRRYKHFDWLLNRLQEKFTIVFVPPLPEKQVTGRYEDEFVEHRMHLLQMWLDIICKHPVLSKSDVWMHFLTCTDDKEWKKGKRKAEKDEFSGGSLFYTIKIPPNPILDYLDVERQIDTFYRSCRGLEEGVRNFQSITHNHAKRMTGPFKAEFTKIANAFRILGGSFEAVEQSNAPVRQLSSALAKTGLLYESIALSYDEQPKNDCTPLLNELFIYKGMLNNVPDVLQVHKSACNKYRESQRMAEEGRVTGQELDQIRSRLDTISCATLAEINHFQKERLLDFNRMMKNFLNGQIAFYEAIVEKLKDAASKYE